MARIGLLRLLGVFVVTVDDFLSFSFLSFLSFWSFFSLPIPIQDTKNSGDILRSQALQSPDIAALLPYALLNLSFHKVCLIVAHCYLHHHFCLVFKTILVN